MGKGNIIPDVGFSLGSHVAQRPRTVLFVLMILVFISLQGAAGAEVIDLGGDLAGTTGEGGVDSGP